MIKVAIVEDDADTRKLVSELIQSDRVYTLTGTYASAEEYLTSLPLVQPDVVILDIHLPGINGIECLQRAKPQYPQTQYIMFTVFEDDEYVFDALRSGATGYLLKKTSPSGIFEAIQNIFNGGSPMSPLIARKVINSFQTKEQVCPPANIELLTSRENEILQALAKGLRYKEISDRYFISMDTVRTHIRNIYMKLQVTSKIEAINKTNGRR